MNLYEFYLTSECSKRVRYWSCYEKTKIISHDRFAYQAAVHERSPHFSLNSLSSWGGTQTGLEKTAEVEPRFSEDYRSLSVDFRTSSKNCPKVTRTLRYTFEKIRRFPKIAEDFRSRPEDEPGPRCFDHQRIEVLFMRYT